MIAGDPTVRNFTGPFPDEELSLWPTDPTDQFFLQQRAIGYNCLNYGETPEPSLYRHQFPEKSYMDANCVDGLRLEMAFPSCGKSGEKDSDNHKSHVAYPSLVKQGNCPEGFDVHYPFLFYETIFATQQFAGMPGQFVLSTGDPVGTSYHADFIMGWSSSDFLGNAINTCTSSSGQVQDCPLFTLQSDDEAAKCKFAMPEDLDGDDCAGPREGLPVGVPIQYGPEPATAYAHGAAGAASPATYSGKPSGGAKATSALPTNPAAESKLSSIQSAIAPSAYSSKPSKATSAPTTTAARAYKSSASSDDDCTTKYITNGYEVVEMVIVETDVTVTATAPAAAPYSTPNSPASAPESALPSAPSYDGAPSYKHKRHMDKHQHKRHIQ